MPVSTTTVNHTAVQDTGVPDQEEHHTSTAWQLPDHIHLHSTGAMVCCHQLVGSLRSPHSLPEGPLAPGHRSWLPGA